MSSKRIKDIYAGKPDAKDEIYFDGLDEFIKTFVVAEHFNIDSLIYGTNCFVTGFKGTGKTALLFYLDNLLKEKDRSTCSSFVFFKEEYTDNKKTELAGIAHRILSSISIDASTMVENKEFEYIWRWIILKRIVSDNLEYNCGLFLEDENWDRFEKNVNSIKAPINNKKIFLPNKLKVAIPYLEPNTQTLVSPEVEVDLQNTSSENYRAFIDTIDKAEYLLSNLIRTDIPYYIFVDELEAYYGEQSVFNRDLYMIRDLVFSVKRFNGIFTNSAMRSTKIICSVRSEILTAISRFIVTKELNKVTAGFSLPLIWNYSNTSSFMHPIIQILLKRIQVCEDECIEDYKHTYLKWFPEAIHNIEPASYILNNSWCKPRDIVRLLSCAQNSIQNNSMSFTQSVFNSIVKAYSEESLLEIKEELRALYDSEDIDSIIACFMGYKTTFSVNQLKDRISKYFSGSVLDTDFSQVVSDLYRLGFLGNFLPISKSYRWQHKGDDRVILSDEWRLFIHYALQSSLSLGSQQNYGLTRGELPQVGDVSTSIVKEVIGQFALIEFKHYGELYEGAIHISEFTKLGYGYIKNLSEVVKKNDEFKTVIKSFSDKYNNWRLEIIQCEEIE